MRERIHKRLPVKFVQEVLESFNQHRISEKEAMDLLGVKKSRFHQLRRGWLLSSRKKPFRLWQRVENAFHVISPEVEQWLDKELRYIRQEAETFRGRFNFAFLAEEAQKRFDRPFSQSKFLSLNGSSTQGRLQHEEIFRVHYRHQRSPPIFMRRMVAMGWHGRKTGKGFYTYS